jgi:hypothetical protein
MAVAGDSYSLNHGPTKGTKVQHPTQHLTEFMQKILSQTLPTGCSTPPRRWQRRFATQLALCGLASLAAGWLGSAQAGEHVYDFNGDNGDPYKNGFVLFGSNTNGWQTNGGFTGVDGDGFLEITPAVNSQTLGILFPLDYFTNADNSLTALPLKGFELDVDIRTGNATGNNGRPADGFSISFASSQDPVVFWGKQGQFRGWAGGDSTAQALEPTSYNYATGTGVMDPAPCDAGNAENGTKTGVSVAFDTWSGNTIIDQNGLAPATGNDNVGWRVHFNGKMIERINSIPASGPLAHNPGGGGWDQNGLYVCPPIDTTFADFTQLTTCEPAILADTNTIETGPYYTDQDDGTSHTGSYTNLGWAHLSVILTTNTPHVLTVTYKGRKLVDNFALTNFSPYVGQLIMGGRTGGANENRDIDNVHIITFPFVASVYNGISSSTLYLNDFSLALANVGPAKVTTINSLTLDGADIKSAATITIGDPNSTIKYTTATPFASGTAHVVVLTWTDAQGNTQTQTSGFTVANWINVPASAAVPASSIDKNQIGFLVQPSQIASGEPNRMYWAQEQLQGLHGTNYIDFSLVNGATNGNEVAFSDVVDFANSGAGGQFPINNDWGILGIPAGTLANPDNSAAAFTAYLYFPAAGTYVMGGNSDDGLLVTFAKNSKDVLGTPVPGLLADAGRGIGNYENIGAVLIPAPGYYGFRMLWENGGGGSAVEWYTTQTPAGVTNVLINDVNNNAGQAVAAYQVSSAAPPYISYAEPPLFDDQFSPDAALKWKISDASTTVNAGSVVLKVNGATTSPTVTPAGGVTTVTLPAPTSLWPLGTNSIDLSFKDSAGTNYDYAYTFVVQPYATLDPSQAVPLGSQDATKPGFVYHDSQIDFAAAGDTGDGIPNQIDSAYGQMAGLWFPTYGANASTSTAVATTPVIDFNVNGSAGDFTNDFLMVGIPGGVVGAPNNTDNIAALFQFWVAFPQAGFYKMGVSSDDGFRVGEGFAPLRQVLHVSGGGVDKDVGAVVSRPQDGNGGFGATPPVTPISAPVVLVTSNTSLSTISGKIAVVDRNFFGLSDADLVYAAQTNGAVAAIVINSPNNGFPYAMGGASAKGTVTIPALNVSGYKTDRDLWTNANLTATIGASDAIELGGADYGKGMGWVDFGVSVPQAGIYPMHLMWENGGGGAGVEFASLQPDGTRILVNDTSNPNALLAWQAVTAGPPQRHTVSVSKSGSTVTITFTGTLFSSPTVDGTYTAVAGATSPYTVPTTAGAAFFRAH